MHGVWLTRGEVNMATRLLVKLWRFVWQWLPHRCRFVEVPGEFVPCGTHGRECTRCGTAVWFNVKPTDGGGSLT